MNTIQRMSLTSILLGSMALGMFASQGEAAPASTYRVLKRNPVTGSWMSDQTYARKAQADHRVQQLGQEFWVTYEKKKSSRKYYANGGTKDRAKKVAKDLRKKGFKRTRLVAKEARVQTISTPAPTPRSHCISFTNRTGKTVKVCIYNASDRVQAIPRKTYKVAPGKSFAWGDSKLSKRRFHVKVYEPKLIKRLLASRNNVAFGSRITFRNGGSGGYSLQASR